MSACRRSVHTKQPATRIKLSRYIPELMANSLLGTSSEHLRAGGKPVLAVLRKLFCYVILEGVMELNNYCTITVLSHAVANSAAARNRPVQPKTEDKDLPTSRRDDEAYSFLRQPIPPFIGYPIPIQASDNALVTFLDLRGSIECSDHLDDSFSLLKVYKIV
ncbi:hypothetical protein EVAR_90065_1 [Eumeta japonica]|uniref:Uncharacterized protein n=1 Tax=Eumeta variegata TaxID=151549 RepID=A0A4C2AAW6_EUMVA|nr:hypothetical protein EVAR_90065_1 [Eumeta japonica]